MPAPYFPDQRRDPPSFDFRSQRFGDDASRLARLTGCTITDCRQELFLADGDLALALESLRAGGAAALCAWSLRRH